MRRTLLLFAPLIFGSVVQPLPAGERRPHPLGVHQHGSAELNLVVEGERVALELVSPADNLLGFEHQARSPADREQLQRTLAILDAGSWIRLTPAAGCELEAREIDSPLRVVALQDEHGHRHDEHGHDDEQGDGDEHGHGHDEAHSEFHISYQYLCRTPEALTGAELLLWQQFEGFERIRGQLIVPAGQQPISLTRDEPHLRF